MILPIVKRQNRGQKDAKTSKKTPWRVKIATGGNCWPEAPWGGGGGGGLVGVLGPADLVPP